MLSSRNETLSLSNLLREEVRADPYPFYAQLRREAPVWQLDGGHAFVALNRTERWIATAVAGAALVVTGEGLLVLVGILAVVQALREAPNTDGDRTALIQFAGLVIALGLLMKMPVPGLS